MTAVTLAGTLVACDPDEMPVKPVEKIPIEIPIENPIVGKKLTAQSTEVTENNPYYDITQVDSLRNGVVFKTRNDTTFLTPEFDVNLLKDGILLPENLIELDTGKVAANILGELVKADRKLIHEATISATLTDENGKVAVNR